MRFDISRQPLVPAFLTLLLLSAVAMWGMDGHANGIFGAIDNATKGSHAVSAPGLISDTGTDVAPALQWIGNGSAFAIPPPALLLRQLQTIYPGWARLVAGFLLLFTALCIGRMTVRYNLYAVGTCIAIPLCGALLCALPTGGETLPALAGGALLALSIKNFSRSFCNGYAFDAVFRASFYLGCLLLLLPQTLPLLLLLPLAVVLFRRTLRETTVALFGLLLPILFFSYVNWGAGGGFTAVFTQAVDELSGVNFGRLLSILSLPTRIVLGGIVLLSLWAILLFLADIYFVGTKARFILLFNIGVMLLSATTLFSPAATPAATSLTAVPAAVLLPLLFIRMRRFIALPLYLLLLAAAFAGVVLQ